MAKQVAPAAFDFELVEDDRLRAAIASSSRISAWIESSRLKLRYRIGKGNFGDVWLATDHQSAEDDDGCREVAVKLFPRVKEDRMNSLLDKLNSLFSKCQGLGGVCSLYGFSIIGGKICIVMKFYEGSIADKVLRLREGKLLVPDVLRYGIELAQGILELHSKGIFVLNIKPSNILLDENDNAILGDFGVPYLLLGGSSPSANMVRRLGTPSYMAPEQWQPEVRGPIGFETDSWGFGCTIVEMLTGVHPWCGKSDDEVYHAVIRKQEKPQIPCDLPPPVENVLRGCFEYDLRNRPLMSDILQVFKSSQNSSLGNGATTQPPPRNSLGYSEWLLLKESLLGGDTVRSRKPSNSCKPESMNVPEGTVVGLERDTDREGFVLVRVHGIHDPLRLHVSSLERVTLGLAAGDWLRLKEDPKKHSPVGILHSIHRDGRVAVGFIGIETLREGKSSEFEMAKAYCLGQFVRVKPTVLSPRFEWPRIRRGGWATGKIQWVLPNGCLVVKFPGILTLKEESSEFLADPAEVELVAFDTCPCLVKKYQHLEDFHWAVRPVLIVVGIFTAVKLGAFVGGIVGRKSKGKKQVGVDSERESHAPRMDGKNTGNSAWVHPKVANMLFREGVSTTPSR